MRFLFLAVLCALVCGDSFSAYYDPYSQTFSVLSGYDSNDAVAYAYYYNEMLTTGWARLLLSTSGVYEDDIQMTGAGYLEGYITAVEISQNWNNTMQNMFNSFEVPANMSAWFEVSLNWTLSSCSATDGSSSHWNQVCLLMNQLQGMSDGYNAAAASLGLPSLSTLDFFALNSNGDMETVQKILSGSALPPPGMPAFGSHCSAYMRVLPDLSDMFIGHTTWSSYYEMLRSFKVYNFELHEPSTAATSVMFSSYPGFLTSVDDYYQMLPTKLVVTETTNGLYTTSLFNKVSNQALMSWVRIAIANRMATSGRTWYDAFRQHNSGTYNNGYFVMDYSIFTPGQPLKNNTLSTIEQIPGFVDFIDITQYLVYGGFIWSDNVPFSAYVYEASGFPQMVAKFGLWFTLQMSPRSQIFRRDGAKPTDLQSSAELLRYNDWQNDELSYGNPGNAISARLDLVQGTPPNAFLARAAFGGIDTKATSSAMVRKGECVAQSGPSTSGGLAPFSWADWPNQYTQGMPTVFDFDFVKMPKGGKAF